MSERCSFVKCMSGAEFRVLWVGDQEQKQSRTCCRRHLAGFCDILDASVPDVLVTRIYEESLAANGGSAS